MCQALWKQWVGKSDLTSDSSHGALWPWTSTFLHASVSQLVIWKEKIEVPEGIQYNFTNLYLALSLVLDSVFRDSCLERRKGDKAFVELDATPALEKWKRGGEGTCVNDRGRYSAEAQAPNREGTDPDCGGRAGRAPQEIVCTLYGGPSLLKRRGRAVLCHAGGRGPQQTQSCFIRRLLSPALRPVLRNSKMQFRRESETTGRQEPSERSR